MKITVLAQDVFLEGKFAEKESVIDHIKKLREMQGADTWTISGKEFDFDESESGDYFTAFFGYDNLDNCPDLIKRDWKIVKQELRGSK